MKPVNMLDSSSNVLDLQVQVLLETKRDSGGMVYTLALGASGESLAGSSPACRMVLLLSSSLAQDVSLSQKKRGFNFRKEHWLEPKRFQREEPVVQR